MTAFNRKTELFIGTFKDESDLGSGFLVDNLDYEFDVTRSTVFYKDAATFTVYNPNRDTINEIMNSGVAVIFKAGYENDQFGTIFVGQIATVYTESDGPEEEKIVIVCNSQRGANYPLQRTYVAAVVEEGKTYFDVLKIIADYVGVPISGAEVLKTFKLSEDYIVCGNVRDEVENFIKRKLREVGGTVIISNNEMLYIDKNDKANFETVNLTFRTGLISVKKSRDEKYQSSEDAFSENQAYYLGMVNHGDKDVAKEKAILASIPSRNVIEFECLINPQIGVGKPIQVDGYRNDDDVGAVNGRFFVTDLRIQGDNFGSQFMMSGKAEEKMKYGT